jgi:hypothetical protein
MAGAGAPVAKLTSIEVLEARLEALERLIDERHLNNKEALDLNAKEMARRLDILNGEAGRLREMQATYVPREIYEASVIKIRALEDGAAYQRGQGQVIAALISAAVSVAVGLMTIAGVYIAKRP